jgi:nuclear protein localization protein 4 homolog
MLHGYCSRFTIDPLVENVLLNLQVSEQCVKLWREGWFQKGQRSSSAGGHANDGSAHSNGNGPVHDARTSGMMPLVNPNDPRDETPVIVAGKDVAEVDADYFLVPVGIKDHTGPLLNQFAVENRLLPQGKTEAKAFMQRLASRPYTERLADFHLLLWLARQPGFGDADVAAVVGAVARKEPVSEGYRLIVDSMVGL